MHHSVGAAAWGACALAQCIASLNVEALLSWEDAVALTKIAPTADEMALVEVLRAEISDNEAIEAELSEAERLVLKLAEVYYIYICIDMYICI